MIVFHSPYWLILIPIIIPLLIWYYVKRGSRSSARLRYSDVEQLKSIPYGGMARLRHIVFMLRLLVVTFLLIAMARPQAKTELEQVYTEGVDIMIALDVSGSMQAIDLDEKNKVNRLDVAKSVIHDFIKRRQNDRIGLVIFASSAFTQCPMTVDYPVLNDLIEQINIGVIDERATAIGNALANSVSRLKNSQANSKVIILLTDGENNAGEIDPLTAAEIAKTYGIRVYTIGAGSQGTALVPVQTAFGQQYQRVQVNIDEKTLQEIAQITDALYFRAKDRTGLKDVFKQINSLEKTKVETSSARKYNELFRLSMFPALGLLLLEIILGQTRFRMLP